MNTQVRKCSINYGEVDEVKELIEKITGKAAKIIKNSYDDFLFILAIVIFIHASFRINSIFGEYMISLIIIICTIVLIKFKKGRR